MKSAYRFAVIGLGRFGNSIARNLIEKKAEVICIDVDEEKIEALEEWATYSVVMDASEKSALIAQNIPEMDAVVVSIGENFQATLLTTFVLQELNVKRIIVRASGESEIRILQKMGIKEILTPEYEVGMNIAEQLMNPGVLQSISLDSEYAVVEVEAPTSIINRNVESIGLRNKYRLNLITILVKKENDEMCLKGVPNKDTVIMKGDILLVFGKKMDIDRFMEINH